MFDFFEKHVILSSRGDRKMNKERKPQFIITSERLKGAMEAVNINASTLSQRTGVSEQSISQYVNGFHAPSNITAGKLATALN